MEVSASGHGYTKKTKLIPIIGALLLLAGIAIGFLGPLEMYCFIYFPKVDVLIMRGLDLDRLRLAI